MRKPTPLLDSVSSPRRQIAIVALLLVVTICVFASSLGNGFVNWDDQEEIVNNPDFNPVTLAGLAFNWTDTRLTLYMPVTYTVWAAVAAVDPRDPAGLLQPWAFHLLNLLLHLLCVLLVYQLLRLLLKNDVAAAIGALVFAVHPLQVEAVAWASGMYTLMSTALGLGALIAYVKWMANSRATVKSQASDRTGGAGWYWLATLLYVIALLSKAAAVAVPVIAAVLALLVMGFNLKAVIRSVLFWVVLAVPMVLLAKHFQDLSSVPSPPLWGRPLVALDALGFYLGKVALPIHLIPDYGRNPNWVMQHPAAVSISVAVSVAVLVLALLLRQRAGWVLAGLALLIAGVLPYLGLTTFDFQYVSTTADRYAYLGMLGVAFLAARAALRDRRVMAVIAAAILAYAVASAVQVRMWQSTRTLFDRTIGLNPNSLVANNVFGFMAAKNHQPDQAERFYKKALQIWPADATIWFNLGNLYLPRDSVLAQSAYEQAVKYQPRNSAYRNNLAVAMIRNRNYQGAADQYRQAITVNPGDPDLHYSLGELLEGFNDSADAAREYQQALSLDPEHHGARKALDRLHR